MVRVLSPVLMAFIRCYGLAQKLLPDFHGIRCLDVNIAAAFHVSPVRIFEISATISFTIHNEPKLII
jgi:hypothetical protein